MSNITWDSSRAIAEIINDKYPDTDVLSLRDDTLTEMVRSIEEFAALPEIEGQERSDCLFCIKVALSRIIEGDEDYDTRPSDDYLMYDY